MVADTSQILGDELFATEVGQSNNPLAQLSNLIVGPTVDPTIQPNQTTVPTVGYMTAVNTEIQQGSILTATVDILGYSVPMIGIVAVGGAALYWWMNKKGKRFKL